MSENKDKKQKQFKKQATKVLSIMAVTIIAIQLIALAAFGLGYTMAETNAQNELEIKAQAVEEYKASLAE